jgi:mannose-6-phosphate isomerase-like protein (cupin superfamily)
VTIERLPLFVVVEDECSVALQAREADMSEKLEGATVYLPEDYDVLAPDGSEIRELLSTRHGSMVHCTLPQGATSGAVSHRNVEEIWYFLQGVGQIWRRRGDKEAVVDVESGVCVSIGSGTHFQFRNTGSGSLCFIIVTMPPWPGEHEAVRVDDYWEGNQAVQANE